MDRLLDRLLYRMIAVSLAHTLYHRSVSLQCILPSVCGRTVMDRLLDTVDSPRTIAVSLAHNLHPTFVSLSCILPSVWGRFVTDRLLNRLPLRYIDLIPLSYTTIPFFILHFCVRKACQGQITGQTPLLLTLYPVPLSLLVSSPSVCLVKDSLPDLLLTLYPTPLSPSYILPFCGRKACQGQITGQTPLGWITISSLFWKK